MSAISAVLGILAALALVPMSELLWRFRHENGRRLRWQLAGGMWLVCAGAATERLVWEWGILATIAGLIVAVRALTWERVMTLLGK